MDDRPPFPLPRTFATSRAYWASRMSIAKFFAPDRVTFHEDHLEIVRPYDPFCLQVEREVVPYHRIASYYVSVGALWCGLDINDVGAEGRGELAIMGFPRSYARDLERVMSYALRRGRRVQEG